MPKDLSDYRKVYNKGTLLETELTKTPFELFDAWWHQAKNCTTDDRYAYMTLSFAVDNRLKSYMVRLHKYSESGFMFFTHAICLEIKTVEVLKKVCLSFFWKNLERQVIIKGALSHTSQTLSNKAFSYLPHTVKLDIFLTSQLQKMTYDGQMERHKILQTAYENTSPPCPKIWRGYVLCPQSIEFWQGRPNRLHDRIVYLHENKEWVLKRLAP